MVIRQENPYLAQGKPSGVRFPTKTHGPNRAKRIQQRRELKKEEEVSGNREEEGAFFRATQRRSEILRPRISESTLLRLKRTKRACRQRGLLERKHVQERIRGARMQVEQDDSPHAPRDNDGGGSNWELSIVTVLDRRPVGKAQQMRLEERCVYKRPGSGDILVPRGLQERNADPSPRIKRPSRNALRASGDSG